MVFKDCVGFIINYHYNYYYLFQVILKCFVKRVKEKE